MAESPPAASPPLLRPSSPLAGQSGIPYLGSRRFSSMVESPPAASSPLLGPSSFFAGQSEFPFLGPRRLSSVAEGPPAASSPILRPSSLLAGHSELPFLGPRRISSMAEAPPAASPPFLHMWHVTDIAWPSPAAAYDACMANAKELLRHGVHAASGVDAFDIRPACLKLGIDDLDSVGLVLWSGVHPRRHDGKDTLLRVELHQHLKWSHTKFLAAALDMLSSSLPQATVIACDRGDRADSVVLPLDHKPLATFQTRYGTASDGSRFHSEASGFDDRHVRPWDSNQFLGCGLIAPFLQPLLLGQKSVDISDLAALVAEAGLHVVFVGEYTCAQSRHCLRRALEPRPPLRRMLCDRPWVTLPDPKRGWKRGANAVYSHQEFREDARAKVRIKHTMERWPFTALHAAANWLTALPRGRACVSDFGHTMWPAAV